MVATLVDADVAPRTHHYLVVVGVVSVRTDLADVLHLFAVFWVSARLSSLALLAGFFGGLFGFLVPVMEGGDATLEVCLLLLFQLVKEFDFLRKSAVDVLNKVVFMVGSVKEGLFESGTGNTARYLVEESTVPVMHLLEVLFKDSNHIFELYVASSDQFFQKIQIFFWSRMFPYYTTRTRLLPLFLLIGSKI